MPKEDGVLVCPIAFRRQIAEVRNYNTSHKGKGEKMKEHGLRPQARRPLLRRVVYVMLAVTCGLVGFGIAQMGVQEERVDFIGVGIAFPFIIVIGEYIRNYLYFRKFHTARCKKCGHDFPFSTLLEKGRCPECRKRRIVGLRPD